LSGLARFVVSADDTFQEKRFTAILPWECARNRPAEFDIRLDIFVRRPLPDIAGF
jgi:hypothetical protein